MIHYGRGLISSVHSLPTPTTQEVHTQPGESETRLQDVRRGGLSLPLDNVIDNACGKGREDERARIRAAVDGLSRTKLQYREAGMTVCEWQAWEAALESALAIIDDTP